MKILEIAVINIAVVGMVAFSPMVFADGRVPSQGSTTQKPPKRTPHANGLIAGKDGPVVRPIAPLAQSRKSTPPRALPFIFNGMTFYSMEIE